MRRWGEIEREERLITAELTRAPPGHPLLGPEANQDNDFETVELPFLAITTSTVQYITAIDAVDTSLLR